MSTTSVCENELPFGRVSLNGIVVTAKLQSPKFWKTAVSSCTLPFPKNQSDE